MRCRCLAAAVFLALTPRDAAARPTSLPFRLHAKALRERALWAADHPQLAAPAAAAQAQYVEQRVDHFDDSNTKTWHQAYFVNDTFWVPGSDAPVILCVGGEQSLHGDSVGPGGWDCAPEVADLPRTRAVLFSVEHRYYGCHNASSCPVPMTPGRQIDLAFLSSRQALADLAAFHAHAVAAYGLTNRNKWISVGGSYPGMLAGWFRLQYPGLVHAAVASSAPVLSKVDTGYNDGVAAAYAVSDVGGSPGCREAIRSGHAAIGKLFGNASGRGRLASLFGNSAGWYDSRANQRIFAGDGVAAFPAQSNDPTCARDLCNIKKICEVMVDASLGDLVDRLARVSRRQAAWAPRPWLVEEPTDEAPSSGYFWSYQLCTEFGLYPTCEVGSDCFFTQGYYVIQDRLDMCKSEFGITADQVAANINATNEFYGGLSPKCKCAQGDECVLFPNGEVDPLHFQSVLKSPHTGIDVLWVPGASHEAWRRPSGPTDQESVKNARAAIRSHTDKYLASPCGK